MIVITDRTVRLRASFYRNIHHAAEGDEGHLPEADAELEKRSDAGSVGHLDQEEVNEYLHTPPRTPHKRQDNRPSPKTGNNQELIDLREQVEQLKQLLLSQQQTQRTQAAKFCVIQ